MTFLDSDILGFPPQRWIIALGTAAILFLVLHLVQRIATARLRSFAARTRTELDDLFVAVLARTRSVVLLVLSLVAGAKILVVPHSLPASVHTILVLTLVVQGGFWAGGLIFFWLRASRARRAASDPAAVTMLSALEFVIRLVLWSLVLLIALDNLGVNITTLVAGLGVGGVAVALALQNVLGDLFASMSIVLDQPFVLGDFIIVDAYMGTVERIGLKSTRVRSLSGEQLIFSNADLLKSRIRNYKRMEERRIVFSFGVTYRTRAEDLAAIGGMVKEIVTSLENTRFDRAHFKDFGDSSLDFEVVYYVTKPDYNLYMDIQQAINLRLFTLFAEKGIEFAYPTRTLYISGENIPANGRAASDATAAQASEAEPVHASVGRRRATGGPR